MITVTAGQNLQLAINNAPAGETISVEAGAIFTGPIELASNLTIQSSRVNDLPQGRVNPSHAPLMFTVVAPNAEQAIRTRPGTANTKIDGVQVVPSSNVAAMYDLVRFGGSRHDQTTLGSVPHHLKLDRSYIHGLSTTSFQRGLTLNSSDSEVTRCYFSEIHGRGMDAQAIASWNTPGRNKIVDCYLEATGENVMFGGADPFSAEFIPSDCHILRSHLFKPLSWKGQGWVIKNLLEFKNGQRIQVDGCILENNWGGEGQSGVGVLFTVRNQEGSAPYSIVKDILFTNNTVLNSEGALNFLGSDNEKPSQRASNVVIKNNVFDLINGPFLTLNGFYDLTLERNTHLQTKNTMTLYGEQSQGFVYRDNVTIEKEYGIFGDGGTVGTAALQKYAPGYAFTGNVLATPYGTNPPNNEYPPSLTIGPDYRHPYAGKGADIDQLLAAQSGASTPMPTPPTPTPPTLVRKVSWPTGEAKQNAVVELQWKDRYRFKRHLAGAYAEFERVP